MQYSYIRKRFMTRTLFRLFPQPGSRDARPGNLPVWRLHRRRSRGPQIEHAGPTNWLPRDPHFDWYTAFCGAHKPSHYLSRRRQQSAQKHQQTSQQLLPPCQPTQRCKNNDAVSHRRNGHIKPENYFVDYLVTLG